MQKALGPLQVPFGQPLHLPYQEFGRGKPLLSIVSGSHGDEYNGVYICGLMSEWLRGMELRSAYSLRGRIRILPALNPLGLLTSERHWPFDKTDVDRVFPGYNQGETTQRLASWVFELLRPSQCCVDLHSGIATFEELPQVLVFNSQPRALELAKGMGLPFVWIRRLNAYGEMSPQGLEVAGSVQGSLAFNLAQVGIEALVVRAGGGLRLDIPYCNQVLTALIRLALNMGVISGPPLDKAEIPQIAPAQDFQNLHVHFPGFFVPDIALGASVRLGQTLGQVIDPLSGQLREEIITPTAGTIVALRTHPVILQGSLVARLLA